MNANSDAPAAVDESGSGAPLAAEVPAALNVLYPSSFFAAQQDGSMESAEIIVPLVLARFRVSSVVDVGCGVGGWLDVFARHGIADYVGIDGDYVPVDMLKIPADRFRAENLFELSDIGRTFDLACCLEVAEHLPERCAEQLVGALVACAPVVLFSAAIPLQGGTAHVNEQWPSYWAEKFARHGYVAVDCIRSSIYGNPGVAWWYRQNVLIFCRPERCPAGHAPARSAYDINRIDPFMLDRLYVPQSGTDALLAIRRALPPLGIAILQKLRIKQRPRGRTVE